MIKIITLTQSLLLIILLAGCGGGGGGGSSDRAENQPAVSAPDGEQVEDDVPEPEDLPVTEEPEEAGQPEDPPVVNEPEISLACDDSEQLAVMSVTASDSSAEFTAEKTLDTSLSTASRWSTTTLNASIVFDFGSLVKISELGFAWYLGDQRKSFFSIESSTNNDNWRLVLSDAESSGASNDPEATSVDELTTRYLKIVGNGNAHDNETSLLELTATGCRDEAIDSSVSAFQGDTLSILAPYDHSALDTGVPPSDNFDLQYWYLSIPTDTDNNGKSDSIYENELSGGYENSDYFYTASDGGMVFKSPVDGFKTSTNTSYVRVELRGMLRRGNTSYSTQGVNKNNWVFGSSPSQARENAGGVDGRLFATLAVNEVTTSGENYQIGRVIIGQIHANDDEPVRLYYRKLPGNSRGSIYIAHEKLGGDEDYYELAGSRSNSADNPDDGIALDEKFSYEIKVIGNFLRVSLLRPGVEPVFVIVDMTDSGYNTNDQYQYFKLGAYHVNNSASMSEVAQVTFYDVEVGHN